MEKKFDYIIVGAGSAGCVLANRLSLNPDVRVLLIEAGPEPRSPWIRIPGGVAKLFPPNSHNYGYITEPEPHLNGRRIYWPRGRGLGGTSAINGMIYLRGHKLDYDGWRDAGNLGWGWDDVLPLFERSMGRAPDGTSLPPDYGALGVSPSASIHPFAKQFVETATHFNHPRRDNFNAGAHDGVGYLEFTIKNGFRCSSYDAFIAPIRSTRRNLVIRTKMPIHKVIISEKRATGILVQQNGKDIALNASKEVILCAGAINSPQLLMLSGVGPADDLRALGIHVHADAANVGYNLQDHAYLNMVYNAPKSYSLNSALQWPRLATSVARYMVDRKGLLAMGASQTCLYAKVDPKAGQPDIQINTRAMSLAAHNRNIVLENDPRITVAVSLLRPEARGRVALKTASALDAPLMWANYLATDKDKNTMLGGVKIVDQIMRSAAMGDFNPVVPLPADDDAIIGHMQAMASAVMHPVGSCRMGPDGQSVVDPQLRVRGIANLRIADASIMPNIVSANTNAASIMIGEKAADLIQAQWR